MRKITLILMSLFLTIGAMAQLSTEKYYKIKNVAADKFLTVVGNNTNLKLNGTTFFKLEDAGEGKFYIKSISKDGDKTATFYIKAENWNFCATTTEENKTPFTISNVDGEAENVYSLYQNTASYTGYAGTDSQDADASVYCNKAIDQNGKWAFEEVGFAKTPETGKQYRLRSAYDGMYMECVDFAKTSGEGAFQLKYKSLNSGQIFELEAANEGKYYLKTKQNETTYYVKVASWNFLAHESEKAEFTIATTDDEWSIHSLHQTSDYSGYAGNINDATDGTKIYCNQPELKKNTTWFFEEVNDVIANITYIYKWNENEIGRETIAGLVGNVYPAYKSIPFGYRAANKSGWVTGDETVVVNCEDNLPFEYATSVNEISKWYFLRMHCNYPSYIQDNNSGTLPYVYDNSVTNDNTRDNYAWGFVGDPISGFIVVNKATQKAITSNGDGDATTANIDNATKWLVKASTERPNNASFFTLKYPSGSNYLNANAPAGKIKHWSKADGGSTINVETYTPQATETLSWSGTNVEMWGDALGLANYPAIAVNEGANGNDVHYATKELVLTGARKISATFRYSSGSCALKILGVDIVDANNNIIAGDYHSGSTGNSSSNNTYTINVADAGTYTMRFYVWTNETERLNDTNGNISISFEEIVANQFSYNVTFAADYATLYLGYKVAIPAGVEAYVLTGVNPTWVELTQLNNIIPANTAVILKGTANSSYNFNYTSDEAEDVKINYLEGSIADRYVQGDAYVLGIPEGETEPALCKAALNKVDNTSFKNNANKAYLPVASGAAMSASLRFDFGGTTGIEEVEIRNEKEEIYDLTGRRVNEITKAGVYIIGGRKILVK